MKSNSLLTIAVNGPFTWFWLVAGSGLIQIVTLALIVLIWNEWPWRKFMLMAVAIGFCDAFTTGLYVALVLLAAKFPEELCEAGNRTDAGAPLELRPRKEQKDDLTGRRPIAA
jgi:hypothetical protein